MRVICPRCKTDLDVSDDMVGTRVRCGACQSAIQLPSTLTKQRGSRPVTRPSHVDGADRTGPSTTPPPAARTPSRPAVPGQSPDSGQQTGALGPALLDDTTPFDQSELAAPMRAPVPGNRTDEVIRCPHCGSTQFFGGRKSPLSGVLVTLTGAVGTAVSVFLMAFVIGFCTIFLFLPLLIMGYIMIFNRGYVNICARCRRTF